MQGATVYPTYKDQVGRGCTSQVSRSKVMAMCQEDTQGGRGWGVGGWGAAHTQLLSNMCHQL